MITEMNVIEADVNADHWLDEVSDVRRRLKEACRLRREKIRLGRAGRGEQQTLV